MSVDEMIAKLGELDAAELEKLSEAVERAKAGEDEERRQAGLAAWSQLLNGLVDGSRTDLSRNIDQRLYRGEA